jgi:hypothetical protein
MLKNKVLFLLAPALVGLGVTGAALASASGGSVSGPLRCAIESSVAGGMVSLEGLAESKAATSGSYRFVVKSVAGSGSSSISQGGGFSARPGETVPLGRVMLGANGIYDAVLTLDAGGKAVKCMERVGGRL